MRENEFQYVVDTAREKRFDLSVCPTCDKKKEEVAPGLWVWGESTYRLDGEEHPCNCVWQDTLRRYYILADIPQAYWRLSEKDWIGDQQAWTEMQSYLNNWTSHRRTGHGIDFYSPNLGTGKTFLAAHIAKQLVQANERVWFIPFSEILSTYEVPWEQRQLKLKRLRNTPTIILDEVQRAISDAQRNYFAQELESIIRFRTSGLGVTILTTNLTPKELDIHYPRVFSLLAPQQTRIHVLGHDVRRESDGNGIGMRDEELERNNERRPIS